MPFPIVWGIPKDTQDEVLYQLRRDIVNTLHEVMQVPPDWVHVFFPKDMLHDPNPDGTEGGNTIYINLDTGMFHGKPIVDVLAQRVTLALAHVVWNAFGGLCEVECMVGDCNPAWTSLIKAKI